MIIGAGSQFPRNNSHCVFQLQNGTGTTLTDTSIGHTTTHTITANGTPLGWHSVTPPTGISPFNTALNHSGTINEYYHMTNDADIILCNRYYFTIELWYKQNVILGNDTVGYVS